MEWECASTSSLIGNCTSQLPTMFCTLKSLNSAGIPHFWTTLTYFFAASWDMASLLAPVQTILPLANIKAVVFGSLMRMMTAAKRLGLYSAFLACLTIDLKSSLQFIWTVATTF
eukprot:CAMPEP_0182613928 /NCGR_PEP_ID=MMETSP1330-20130603/28036_1 /TAXON_ID=464278 /ORGANISM="Picochlorum sp., Strain RCC944" /LENGTH=113 /DNA_ID=CAMNT_0024833697 /DNA_START=167 /DNA_END=508 /DNA_ORIENTATION=-